MISKQHELHKRRYGRNLGVGLLLSALIVIVFGLTVVKVTNEDFDATTTGGTVDGN